jgi:hypothetical protein
MATWGLQLARIKINRLYSKFRGRFEIFESVVNEQDVGGTGG